MLLLVTKPSSQCDLTRLKMEKRKSNHHQFTTIKSDLDRKTLHAFQSALFSLGRINYDASESRYRRGIDRDVQAIYANMPRYTHTRASVASHRPSDCLPIESWNRCNKLIGAGYIAATRFVTMRRSIAATFAITEPHVAWNPYRCKPARIVIDLATVRDDASIVIS